MRMRFKSHWLLIAAVIATMANVFAAMAPASVQAAPGTLLDALSVICGPDGEKHRDGESPHFACDHCILCPIGLAALPAGVSCIVSPRSQSTPAVVIGGHQAPLVDTISHRPLGQAPPATLC